MSQIDPMKVHKCAYVWNILSVICGRCIGTSGDGFLKYFTSECQFYCGRMEYLE